MTYKLTLVQAQPGEAEAAVGGAIWCQLILDFQSRAHSQLE